jgi:Cu-Zn family superoxide dismutase
MKTSAIGVGVLVMGLAMQGWAAKGIAEVKGTAANSPIQGTVNFEDTAAGLKVSAHLTGVPPGQHGFHIHEFGDCADMGKAAGGHYNPMHMPHGDVLKDGTHKAHVGDMGNVTAGADGQVTLDVVLHDITLADSQYTIGGRAIILHEKVDDFSQPTGNAGGRIACGPIVIVGAPAPAAPPAK